MKRPPKLLATEIVPGKIYLAPRRDSSSLKHEPAEVICTTEPGWLRGFVAILAGATFFGKIGGTATVRFIEDDAYVSVPVYRDAAGADSPWVFATGPMKHEPATLLELPPDWFDRKLHELEVQKNELVLQIGRIEDARSQFLVMAKKAAHLG